MENEEVEFDYLDTLLQQHRNTSIFDFIASDDELMLKFWAGEPVGVVVNNRQFFAQIKITER